MENWKSIEGFSQYMINDKGGVKSIKFNKETLMSPKLQTKGYLCVGLYGFKTEKTCLVHRLVALHFIPNPENKPQVNHINGIKTDNRVENLEWCDNSENQKHSFKMGLNISLKGEKQNGSKLKPNQIYEIRNSSLKNKELCKIYNVKSSTISSIIYRRTWKHI